MILDPVTWMLGAIVAVSLLFNGKRAASIAALLGILCYGMSYALQTAWTKVPVEHAVAMWQAGIAGTLLMYASVGGVLNARTLSFAPIALVLLAPFDRHVLETVVMAASMVSVLLIYRGIGKADTLAMLVWAILLVGESWALVEKAVCPNVAQHFEGASQCARAFGPVEPHLATGITLAFLAYIGVRWKILHRTTR